MHYFEDKNKQRWSIELNVGTAKRVLNECGIDLINVISAKGDCDTLEKLSSDPFVLVNVLYSLCREQAKELSVDDFEFATLFDALTIENATEALMEEIINFSQPAKRKMLTRIYQSSRIFAEQMNQKLEKVLESPELDEEIQKQLGKLFTDMPESSAESTPDRTPSGN